MLRLHWQLNKHKHAGKGSRNLGNSYVFYTDEQDFKSGMQIDKICENN